MKNVGRIVNKSYVSNPREDINVVDSRKVEERGLSARMRPKVASYDHEASYYV